MRRRVLLLAISPPEGMFAGYLPYAFSSDAVYFDIPGVFILGITAGFKPRISDQDDVTIERRVSVWPLGGNSVQNYGTITLLNGDRALDYLIGNVKRNWRYELRWCWDDEATDPAHTWAACTVWQSGIIENIHTTDGDKRIVLTLADPLARWDKPLQHKLYPESFPNVSARGKPLPITLGQVLFAPGVLRDTSDVSAEKWTYELHDERLIGVTAAYDRGSLFIPNGDWKYPADRKGIQLVNKPVKPVSISVNGQFHSGSLVLHTNFATDPWAGGDPSGWTRYVGSKVAGGWRMNPPGTAIIGLTINDILIPNKNYIVMVICSSAAYGSLTVSPLLGFHIDAIEISSAGVHTMIVTASPASRGLYLFATAACDITIESVTVEEIHDVSRLPRFIEELQTRMRLSGADTSAIAALDAAAPYTLGVYADSQITGLTVLRRALDAWCGWVTTKRDGSLTVGRLEPRNGKGTVRLGSGQIITVRRYADTAPGLTTRLAGLRVHKVHGDSDIASGVDGTLRATLQTEYTTKTGAGTLPVAYEHANGADPRPTLIQDATQLQAAADYVVGLFAQGPFTWYEVDAAISDDIADGLEMGDWLHITHNMTGLDSGKWLCLLGATIRFHQRRVTLFLIDLPES